MKKNISRRTFAIAAPLTVLAGCQTFSPPPDPENPKVVVRKHHDAGYWINYPGGNKAYKPEAYWLLFSDDTWAKVDQATFDRYQEGDFYPAIRGRRATITRETK